MYEMEKNEVLKIYKSVGALLEGHFILSSGLHSKVYLQSALIFSDPVIAKVICKKLVELIKTKINVNLIDIIISPALGGILLGYEISRQLSLPNIFVERVKGDFSIRRGFQIKPGSKILVVEDVITTGKSSLECFDCVRSNGGEIIAEATLINRGGNKVDLGVPLISLATLDIPNYHPDNLPDHLKNTIAVKPGSRPG